MATEKTPDHKRIVRAENSAQEWKRKAIERREALEALTEQFENAIKNIEMKESALDQKDKKCINLEKQVKELAEQLNSANQLITKIREEENSLKKKPFVNWRKTSKAPFFNKHNTKIDRALQQQSVL